MKLFRRYLLSPNLLKLIGTKTGCAAFSSDIKQVPLHSFHVEHGAKMVPFAGFSMPVYYSDQSLIESHLHTRSGASLFDVSHMLQTKIYGKHRVEFMESLVPSDIKGLKPDHGALTAFTNERGGIKDDLIVTNTSCDYLYVVTNAGCIAKDISHMQEHLASFRSQGHDVSVEHVNQSERCLIAVQGPAVSKIFNKDTCSIDFSRLYFMSSSVCSIFGIPDCRLSRCGYTGEDGVEISIDSKRAAELCNRLLQSTVCSVKLAGLGARDSLRLEAGLCLYGSDIDENTTPIEAGLTWIIGKRRREAADFPGAKVILEQIRDKNLVKRKRIGIVSDKGRPPRSACTILTDKNEEVGRVTSGCPSPSLKNNIAMGYCLSPYTSIGTKLHVNVTPNSKQANLVEVKVVKMPFVGSHYYSEPKKS